MRRDHAHVSDGNFIFCKFVLRPFNKFETVAEQLLQLECMIYSSFQLAKLVGLAGMCLANRRLAKLAGMGLHSKKLAEAKEVGMTPLLSLRLRQLNPPAST
jgi:hypothetical protein